MPEDAIGQHDVAGPAARPAEAHEDAIPAGPVLGNQPLAAVRQRQRHRARRAVPGRIAAVPRRVGRKPAPLDVAAHRDAVTSGGSVTRESPGGRP